MAITYQHPNTQSDDSFEIIEVGAHRVACDGGEGPLGHPRVYLQLDHEADKVVCPYCSRAFLYNRHRAA